MPLAPFFDALCIGEAEPILPELVPVLMEGIGGPRPDLLKALAALPGIYVPPIPPEKPVVRQWAKDLDDVRYDLGNPDAGHRARRFIPHRGGAGLPRGCRFCLVNTNYAPMRFRSVDRLVAGAREGLPMRRRLGLMGPAVTDHPQIKELLARLNGLGAELSLSSMRINFPDRPMSWMSWPAARPRPSPSPRRPARSACAI